MERIVIFDRFRSSDIDRAKEEKMLSSILKGIFDGHLLNIRYRSNKGRILSGIFTPVVVEYSKRNDRFQAYLITKDEGRMYTLNLSQFEDITQTEEEFDRDEAEEFMNDSRKADRRSVEITFYNRHRLLDRILMELSPWEKRCSYDKATGLYTLTLYYQRQDEAELIIRLMEYGPHIRFLDRGHSISLEIRSRLERQVELFRENRRERELTER